MLPLDEMSRRSQHKPEDKISSILRHSSEARYSSSYEVEFPARQTTPRFRPTIDGYHTDAKNVLETGKSKRLSKPLLLLITEKESKQVGRHRCAHSVSEIEHLRHGAPTKPLKDFRALLFPGYEGEVFYGQSKLKAYEARLDDMTHGIRSGSDYSGGRTLKALRYEPCETVAHREARKQKHSPKAQQKEQQPVVDRKIYNTLTQQEEDQVWRVYRNALAQVLWLRKKLSVTESRATIDKIRRRVSHVGNITASAVGDMLEKETGLPIDLITLMPFLTNDTSDLLLNLLDLNVPLASLKLGRMLYVKSNDR